jgi:hypothetical protein
MITSDIGRRLLYLHGSKQRGIVIVISVGRVALLHAIGFNPSRATLRWAHVKTNDP